MSQSLLEIVPPGLRSFEVGEFFPKVDTFVEALAWRGPELHISKSGYAFFRKGGAGVDLRDLTAASHVSPELDISLLLKDIKQFALSFDDPLALISQLEIPNTTQGRTDKILDLRRSQTIPVESTDYLHGWFSDQSFEAKAQRQVTEIIIRRDMVTPILTAARAVGAKCELVFVRSGLAPALPVAWNEAGLPYKSAEKKALFTRMYFGFTFSGLGALALAITVLYHQNIASQALNDQIALLQPKASALAKHQKAQELLQLQLRQLTLSVSPSRLTSQHIENLARALDDTVVLTSLDFDQGVMTIDGMSPAPEQLIDVLSKQKGLKDVAFVAPVFRNPGELKSRFSVRLTVSGPIP